MIEVAYYALFYKVKNGWKYQFNDVGGTGTGSTLETARENAKETLRDDLAQCVKLGETFPPPTKRIVLERLAQTLPDIGEGWRVESISTVVLIYPRERITVFRESLGLSQHEFAAKLGAHRSAVCWWENGSRPITRLRVMQICYEFNVRREWLENGRGDMLQPVKRPAAEKAKDERMRRAVGFLLGCTEEFRDALYNALEKEFSNK